MDFENKREELETVLAEQEDVLAEQENGSEAGKAAEVEVS